MSLPGQSKTTAAEQAGIQRTFNAIPASRALSASFATSLAPFAVKPSIPTFKPQSWLCVSVVNPIP